MNSLRIQLVKLNESNCKDHAEYPFAVLVSQDSLIWWPINRYKTVDEGLEASKAYEKFFTQNQLIKAESIIWTTKL